MLIFSTIIIHCMKSIDTLVKDIYDLFDSQTVNTLDDTEIDKYLDKELSFK